MLPTWGKRRWVVADLIGWIIINRFLICKQRHEVWLIFVKHSIWISRTTFIYNILLASLCKLIFPLLGIVSKISPKIQPTNFPPIFPPLPLQKKRRKKRVKFDKKDVGPNFSFQSRFLFHNKQFGRWKNVCLHFHVCTWSIFLHTI